MPAWEGVYATSAQLHAAQPIRTAAGLHRLVIHPRAALRGAIQFFNSHVVDSLRSFMADSSGLPFEEAEEMGSHVSTADPGLRVRRRVVGDQ
jgi:hypothetical protein